MALSSRHYRPILLRLGLLLWLVACADQTVTAAAPIGFDSQSDAAPTTAADASTEAAVDAASPDAAPIRAACTQTFGHSMSPSFGRLDGTVRAVIVPTDRRCRGDDNHVVVQIDAANGDTYPMAINILSDLSQADPTVSFANATKTLVGPAWAVGWHQASLRVDYPTTLGVHAVDFASKTKDELAALVASQVPVGAKVSAYVYGFVDGTGGHKLHRNGGGDDGALVVMGNGTPSWLLFRFSEQSF